MPIREELSKLGRRPKVILLGSGGLSIGQAGEFDYSGTQAVKALSETDIDVIIINPNIATVQTNPNTKSKVYLYPVEADWIEKVIIEEKADAIIAGFGGQTALNALLALDKAGILAQHGVLNLGTSPDSLRASEDRWIFAQRMREINLPVLVSRSASSKEEAMAAANELGFPLIVRSAFALGGQGSGFVNNPSELEVLLGVALAISPQVLLEKSLRGWKEIEYEVMRDSVGNCITICNMENFDPLGIHTGDSIVVTPSQTLTDNEYQMLRNAAIKIATNLEVVGECNVQFSLDPFSEQFYIIEVNARLSRSSALASKASGYPIAYIAAKVVLGFDLLELKNPVTGITTALYEPALDYVTVKIPRWDMRKFPGVSAKLGSAMKSVGEVMAIGRSFPEALQKAIRMVTENPEGLSRVKLQTDEAMLEELRNPTDQRIFSITGAFRSGMTLEKIHELTNIDKWFLSRVREIIEIETEISKIAARPLYTSVEDALATVDQDSWRRWKQFGFGDEQITSIAQKSHLESKKKELSGDFLDKVLAVRKLRIKAGVLPVVKKIDTTAGEFISPSNYLYVTYHGDVSDLFNVDQQKPAALVLGSGAYRIGASVEFDWCGVGCLFELKRAGWRSIVLNCNPETVSTDFNNSDHLYFEEPTLERILDVVDFEKPKGTIISMGGQLPNFLAKSLSRAGVHLLGHSISAIDRVEDRSKFSALLDGLGIDQPKWISAQSSEEILSFIGEVGFPVIVRPSYVLSGAAMRVAYDQESLDFCLDGAEILSPDHPVVISKYFDGAREIEVDGIAKDGKILEAIVSEHIENAGVHSGDATVVCPPQGLNPELIKILKLTTDKIAWGLKLNGPFNIQYLAQTGLIFPRKNGHKNHAASAKDSYSTGLM